MLTIWAKVLGYKGSEWILDKYFNIKIELHKNLPSVQAKAKMGSLCNKESTQ